MGISRTPVRQPEFEAGLLEAVPHVRAFARSLARNKEEADDLTHDAVLRALAAADQFTPGTNLKAWIFTIARNLFYTEQRKRSMRTKLSHRLRPQQSLEASPEAKLEFKDFQRAFWQLNDVHREALTLVGASGLSYEDAAAVCGCPVGTMKSRVSRARQHLKDLIGDGDLKLPRRTVAGVEGTQADAADRATPRSARLDDR